MRERPIPFSGPMVRAILEGSKTQTRRIMNPQPPKGYRYGYASTDHSDNVKSFGFGAPKFPDMRKLDAGKEDCRRVHWFTCPYGQPGDRFWVREDHHIKLLDARSASVCYLADGLLVPEVTIGQREHALFSARKRPNATTRARFMWRCLSRITLELTAVRVERLQDISEEDADAEGALNSSGLHDFDCEGKCFHAGQRCDCGGGSIAKVYKRLWESINGAGSWAKNPWVWVVEFRRVTP